MPVRQVFNNSVRKVTENGKEKEALRLYSHHLLKQVAGIIYQIVLLALTSFFFVREEIETSLCCYSSPISP